jgi:stage II sporulation protein M
LEIKKSVGFTGFLFGEQEEYVRRITPLFALSLMMFLFSTIIGYYLGDSVDPSVFEGVLSNIPNPSETDFLGLLSAIIINNITASLIFVVSGLIIGVPPLLFMAFNGFFVGWIA